MGHVWNGASEFFWVFFVCLFVWGFFAHSHGSCFLQVWCPIVFVSSGHLVLLKIGLQDTLSYKMLQKWATLFCTRTAASPPPSLALKWLRKDRFLLLHLHLRSNSPALWLLRFLSGIKGSKQWLFLKEGNMGLDVHRNH